MSFNKYAERGEEQMGWRKKSTILLVLFAVAVVIAYIGMNSNPKVDGQSALKHADIYAGDAIVINAKPDSTILDEGYGNVFVMLTDRFDPKVSIYKDVHWAVGYHTSYPTLLFIIYAWND